jgi:hypothetical protein
MEVVLTPPSILPYREVSEVYGDKQISEVAETRK